MRDVLFEFFKEFEGTNIDTFSGDNTTGNNPIEEVLSYFVNTLDSLRVTQANKVLDNSFDVISSCL